MRLRRFRRRNNLLHAGIGAAIANVFGQAAVKQAGILGDNRNLGAQAVLSNASDILVINPDLTAV